MNDDLFIESEIEIDLNVSYNIEQYKSLVVERDIIKSKIDDCIIIGDYDLSNMYEIELDEIELELSKMLYEMKQK
jgi:hypothetical protein